MSLFAFSSMVWLIGVWLRGSSDARTFFSSVGWVEVGLEGVGNDVTTVSSNFVEVHVCHDAIKEG